MIPSTHNKLRGLPCSPVSSTLINVIQDPGQMMQQALSDPRFRKGIQQVPRPGACLRSLILAGCISLPSLPMHCIGYGLGSWFWSPSLVGCTWEAVQPRSAALPLSERGEHKKTHGWGMEGDSSPLGKPLSGASRDVDKHSICSLACGVEAHHHRCRPASLVQRNKPRRAHSVSNLPSDQPGQGQESSASVPGRPCSGLRALVTFLSTSHLSSRSSSLFSFQHHSKGHLSHKAFLFSAYLTPYLPLSFSLSLSPCALQ